MRARIDVSEIEAQTKIRAKYLRALENEEWDLLPGPTFVRSFLRTYAQALGLDAKAIVDEYRMNYEQPSELDHQPVMSPPRRAATRTSPNRSAGPSRAYMIAVGAFGLLIVVLIVALVAGQKKGAESPRPSDKLDKRPAEPGLEPQKSRLQILHVLDGRQRKRHV